MAGQWDWVGSTEEETGVRHISGCFRGVLPEMVHTGSHRLSDCGWHKLMGLQPRQKHRERKEQPAGFFELIEQVYPPWPLPPVDTNATLFYL